MIKKTLCGVVLSIASVSTASAAEEVSVSASVDYVSKYVFRGIQLAEGAIQPGVEIGVGGFYAGIWHSSPVEDDEFYSDETDYYIGYSFDLNESVSADIGVTHYAYPGEDTNTTEYYAGLSFSAPIDPSVYVYYDEDLEAWTLEGSGGYSWPVAENTSFDVSAAIGTIDADGYDAEYGSVSAAFTKTLSENVSGYVGVSLAANSEDTFYDSSSDLLAGDTDSSGAWFSVGLSFSN